MFFVANALALTAGPAFSGVAAEWIEMRTLLLVPALMPLASVAGALLLADPRPPVRPTDVTDVEPGVLVSMTRHASDRARDRRTGAHCPTRSSASRNSCCRTAWQGSGSTGSRAGMLSPERRDSARPRVVG